MYNLSYIAYELNFFHSPRGSKRLLSQSFFIHLCSFWLKEIHKEIISLWLTDLIFSSFVWWSAASAVFSEWVKYICNRCNQSPHCIDENGISLLQFLFMWSLLICVLSWWSTAIHLVIVSGLNRSFWSHKSNNYLYSGAGPLWNMLHVHFFCDVLKMWNVSIIYKCLYSVVHC